MTGPEDAETVAGAEPEPPQRKKKRAPRCVDHPDVRARDTCRRCGDYRCEACFGDERSELCLRCVPHRLPWRRERTFDAFGRTLGLLLGPDGRDAMARDVGTSVDEGADAFTRHVGVVVALLMLVTTLLRSPESVLCAAVLGVPMAAVVFQVSGFVLGVLYHWAARALGGTATRDSSISASYFASATRVPITALRVAGHLLVLATGAVGLLVVFVVLQLVGELWLVVLLAAHARGQHELSPTRAVLAAAAPMAVLAALGVGLVLVLWSGADREATAAGVRAMLGG
jgi:hypothetical protein